MPPPTWPSIFHRVGNERVNGVALTNGDLLLKHDERFPTVDGIGNFIDNSRPYTGAGWNVSGGGWGYLVDAAAGGSGRVLAATRQQSAVGPSSPLSLAFGVGYVQKNTTAGGVTVSQTVHAPFGTDPVLLGTTKLTNTRLARATLRWVDVWPARTALMNAGRGTPNYQRTARAASLLPGGGDLSIVATTRRCNATGPLPKPGPPFYPAAEARWQDSEPLPLLFAALPSPSAHVSGFTTSAERLWGAPHSVAAPNPQLGNGSAASFFDQQGSAGFNGVFAIGETTLCVKRSLLSLAELRVHTDVAERTVILAPGETVELRSLFGYLPVGYTAASIVQRYAGDAASSLGRTVRGWEATPQPRLRVPGAEGVWLSRELRWHTYMLRAGITRMDLFWNEAMLNQNGNYMYYFPRPLSVPLCSHLSSSCQVARAARRRGGTKC